MLQSSAPSPGVTRELLAKAGLGSDDDDSEDNSGGADSDAGDGAGSRKRKLTAAMGGGRLRKSSRLTEAGTAPIDGEGGGADERALFDDDEEEGAAAPPQADVVDTQDGAGYAEDGSQLKRSRRPAALVESDDEAAQPPDAQDA
ncbi:hypothetical protein HaLaN_19899 [Haematococcus lacustris]|uniref:Uncharacterized protein n=1 Tax=Haematococcus lacustris TaxID=44745 RepID=A0A699ZUQ1_HAELA|nr:hypothetical protein HaLaN_19899 [Haematococcus lacustris]